MGLRTFDCCRQIARLSRTVEWHQSINDELHFTCNIQQSRHRHISRRNANGDILDYILRVGIAQKLRHIRAFKHVSASHDSGRRTDSPPQTLDACDLCGVVVREPAANLFCLPLLLSFLFSRMRDKHRIVFRNRRHLTLVLAALQSREAHN